jgi:hypothetical protein
MIHAETVSCIAALDLDATSAVKSKLLLAENSPSLPHDNVHYEIGNGEILDSARSCARSVPGQSRRIDRTPLTSGLARSADILMIIRHVAKVPLHKVAALQPAARGARTERAEAS